MKKRTILLSLLMMALLLLFSCDIQPKYSYSLNGDEIAVYSNTSFMYEGAWVKFAKDSPPLSIYSTNGQTIWIHKNGEDIYKTNIGIGTTLIK